ncbi:MAG: 16S rRNA (adenine(1518)-N(6)/adenine(1519)-N(6))-dimethyltransferase RsmA [Candidatus Ancillula sp.]|jgi:16S rRNA (adenine1518-N6/adenine1519-N6)-dimethyltransferase|nr:16S rRNA (adenine(1518)-N(6)/adenine(1519)-N(6))-dimethyltransferase RsmA [Candidatus Ancillula sp.]
MGKLLTPSIVRKLTQTSGIYANKRLGQNFMVDSSQVEKIVRLANVVDADNILEVGPGLGSLTAGLLNAHAYVVAVEIDGKLSSMLKSTLQGLGHNIENLKILHADALMLKHDDQLEQCNKLVANLPYNVGVPILITLLTRFAALNEALVLVQAEVADRLTAEPGSKEYGIPSAKLAYFGVASQSAVVPRSAFWPVPHVDSKLVKFTRYTSSPFCLNNNSVSQDDVFALINLAFSARRKTLKSLLVADGYGLDIVQCALESLQIDLLARGETLSIHNFVKLASILKNSDV